MTKKALMACCNYWESPFQVGSHQIAKVLVRNGWEVAFISAPISPLHYLKRVETAWDERVKSYLSHGKEYFEGHLFSYVPGSLLAPANVPILSAEFLYRNWQYLSYPSVAGVVASKDFDDVDLLYMDDVRQTFWPKMISYRKSVFRVADKNDAFKQAPSCLNHLSAMIAKQADLTVYSAATLEQYVDSLHPKASFLLRNGVDYAHFADFSGDMPREYQEIPHPRALYIGAMNEWFDYSLVCFLAGRMPNVSFVMIGNDDRICHAENEPKNIFFLGRRSYDVIPGYIHYADVGIIPFNVQDYPNLVNHVNPLKLYEYMAGGLPVLASFWEELGRLQSPALLYRNPEEALQKLQMLLSNGFDKLACRKYAKAHAWEEQVHFLLKKLLLE